MDSEQAYRELHSAGAHLVLCKRSRTPLRKGWPKHKPGIEQVLGHVKGGLPVGLVPASINLVVVDCDEPGSDEQAASALGAPLAKVRTDGKHKEFHLYYPYPGGKVGNGYWAGGEIRGDNSGYATLWDVQAVAELLGRRESWPAAPNLSALPGASGGASSNGGPPAARPSEPSQREREALAHVKPPPRYEEWVAWLAGLKGLGFTLEEVDEWSQRGEKYEQGEVLERWEGLRGTEQVGAMRNRLIVEATEAGWEPEETGRAQGKPAEQLLTPEGYGPGGCTPLADAARMILGEPTKLLLVRHGDGSKYTLRVAAEGGRWSGDRAVLGELLREVTQKWFSGMLPALREGAILQRDVTAVTGHAKRTCTPAGLRDAETQSGIAAEGLRTFGRLPDELTECHVNELDADPTVLGAPNGVIDLTTGELLESCEARQRRVTLSIPDDYVPGAEHDAVTDLVAHLPEATKDYVEASLGWALRCPTPDEVYLWEGETKAGKSTLAAAVHAALGDYRSANGYSSAIPSEALLAGSKRSQFSNSHQDGVVDALGARLGFASEPERDAEGNAGRVNMTLLKKLTGGDPLSLRRAGESSEGARVATMTLFWACNPVDRPDFGLRDDAASQERVRAVPWLQLPGYVDAGHEGVDRGRRATVAGKPEVRQACVAWLVRCASEAADPPEPPPAVFEASKALARHELGELGVWLRSNVEVTKNHPDTLSTRELLSALRAEGADGGLELRDIGVAVRAYLDLDKTGNLPGLEEDGETRRRGWRGARLKPRRVALVPDSEANGGPVRWGPRPHEQHALTGECAVCDEFWAQLAEHAKQHDGERTPGQQVLPVGVR